jgi:4-carboxymuconolactone decarboxylase
VEAKVNKGLFDLGEKTRREILGSKHVEKSAAAVDEFSLPFRELVTQYCWGEIWSRPGLDRRTRSIINLALLTALNRPVELKLHIRAAITNNGLTKEDVREVLLQTMIYCGVPAAVDSFRIAQEVFKEEGK